MLKDELINPTIDLAIDYSSILIDSLTDNELLAEIPFVKTIVAGTNIVLAVKEKFFIKKLLTFLSQFHKSLIDNDSLREFPFKLENDQRYREQVVEVITVMIDRHSQVIQSKVMANLFTAHINGYLSWERLNDVCITLDSLHPMSYEVLYTMSVKTNIDLSYSYWGSMAGKPPEDRRDIFKFTIDQEAVLLSAGIISPHGTHYTVTNIGKDLFRYGIFPLFK